MPDNNYESQKRWNAANYKQINIAVRPELAEAFRSACEQAGTSLREAFISLMTAYTATPMSHRSQKDRDENEDKGYTGRSRRRKAVAAIVSQLEMIRDAEEGYKENIPANLRNSSRYEAAEQAVEALDEAIGILEDVFT